MPDLRLRDVQRSARMAGDGMRRSHNAAVVGSSPPRPTRTSSHFRVSMFTFGTDIFVARASVRGFRAGIDLGMLVLAVCVHADAGWLDGGGCCRGWACGWLAAGCYGGSAGGVWGGGWCAGGVRGGAGLMGSGRWGQGIFPMAAGHMTGW